jgi:hypothetical protein
MLMVLGGAVVVLGVIIGWFTVAGSGIHDRPWGRDKLDGENVFDDPWKMNEWSRGTASRRRRR